MNLDALPWHALAPSARVDFLQLAAGSKPAVRIDAAAQIDIRVLLHRWAAAERLGAASDSRYTCIAATAVQARHILCVDSSPWPHELDLGSLLGYPTCCSRAVADIGEKHIDELSRMATSWHLRKPFDLIDPSGYVAGSALISHIPCSPRCLPSWNLASHSLRWLHRHSATTSPTKEPWRTWVVLRNAFT